MVSEKLIAFILKARANKRNDDQIAQQLLSVGWKQESISEAFSEIKSHKMTAPTAAQSAKMAQQAAATMQPQPTSPPWATPAAARPAPAQAAQEAQPAAPQQPPSASSQSSSAPAGAVQSAPQPADAQQGQAGSPLPLQAPSLPVIPTPQPSPQSPLPAASPIQLPARKKSFLSSLFGKKQQAEAAASPVPAQPAVQAQAQQPAAQAQAPAVPQAARQPVSPPRIPSQSTLQVPASSPLPTVQGQSTLATFAGTAAQQGASSTAPPGAAQQPQPPPPAQPSPQFSQAQPQPASPQQKIAGGMVKFLPIIVFALILALAGAYYVFVMMPAASVPAVPGPPVAPPAQNATPANPVPAAYGPIDCGTGMDCFIRASGTCTRAKIIHNTSSDLSGLIVSGSTYMEIQNASGAGKCSLYLLTRDSSAKFSDAAVAAALAGGASIDEIKRKEADSAAQAKAAVGLSGSCKYGISELSAMLVRWNAGKFAGSDYSGAECGGSMFEGTIFPANANATVNANATATPPKANATVKANTTATPPKANATTAPPKANATVNANATTAPPKANTSAGANATANASSSPHSFTYIRKYTSYYPEHLAWFCPDRKSEFYRVHWVEYFGGGCSVPKPKDGYVDFGNYTATGCTMIPCCVNGPYDEYSRSYDYFECGSN
ncbi:MAG: hypothetical protein WC263_04680 [Candidatus Micrarchaeia archaeon]|jgi:hypothetical protein